MLRTTWALRRFWGGVVDMEKLASTCFLVWASFIERSHRHRHPFVYSGENAAGKRLMRGELCSLGASSPVRRRSGVRAAGKGIEAEFGLFSSCLRSSDLYMRRMGNGGYMAILDLAVRIEILRRGGTLWFLKFCQHWIADGPFSGSRCEFIWFVFPLNELS